jgi:hypothetical protein
MTDQYTFTDPVSQYRQDGYPEQHQDPAIWNRRPTTASARTGELGA